MKTVKTAYAGSEYSGYEHSYRYTEIWFVHKGNYIQKMIGKFCEKFVTDRPEALPALTLAYIGDGYYELVVRNRLLTEGTRRVEELHTQAVALVRAAAQARLARLLEPQLTEAEVGVLHRGRNAKGQHVPKGAKVTEYRLATGLEALVGYWYLTGAAERLAWAFDSLWQLERLSDNDKDNEDNMEVQNG